MSITCSELVGSPIEEYTADGYAVCRLLLVVWEDRHQFIEEVFSTNGDSPVRYYCHVGALASVAAKVRCEPYDRDDPSCPENQDTSSWLHALSEAHRVSSDATEPLKFAKVTVWYVEEKPRRGCRICNCEEQE